MSQLNLSGELTFSKEEEKFFVELAKEVQDYNLTLDISALKEIGLNDKEIDLIEQFYIPAAQKKFSVFKICNSDCIRSCISALEFLPRADMSGKITIESYKASDNIFAYEKNFKKVPAIQNKWSEKFRYEYGHALINFFKENLKQRPALLIVLKKIFEWIVDFQKKNNLFEELPAWLQAGMRNDFKDDSWIGSDLYEGDKENRDIFDNNSECPVGDSEEISDEKLSPEDLGLASDKQKKFLNDLIPEIQDDKIRTDIQQRVEFLKKRDCSKVISFLLAKDEMQAQNCLP